MIVMYGSMKVETCVDLTYSDEKQQRRNSTEGKKKRKERKCFSFGGLIILFVCLTRVRTKSTSRLPRAAKAHSDLSKHRESVLCDIFKALYLTAQNENSEKIESLE